MKVSMHTFEPTNNHVVFMYSIASESMQWYSQLIMTPAEAGRWATHRGAGARLPLAPAAAPAVAPGGGPAARDLSRRAAVFHNQWHCVFSIEIWDQCHGLQLPLQQPSVQLPPGHAPLQIRGEGGSSRRRRRTCVVVSWRARRSGGQNDCQVDPDLWALSQNSKKWSIFEVHINLVRSLVGYNLTCGWHFFFFFFF